MPAWLWKPVNALQWIAVLGWTAALVTLALLTTLVDPSRRMAFGMIVNSGHGTPFGDFRTGHLSSVALRCADAWRRSFRS